MTRELKSEILICISVAAYADDLIILGNTVQDTQAIIDELGIFLEKRGLEINPKKCTALTVKRAPNKKKLYVKTDQMFKSKDAPIPQMEVNDLFKYLGKKFTGSGIQECNCIEIQQSLNNLKKAPLKPQQKLMLLKFYFIPRVLNSLQYPGITIDRSIPRTETGNIILRKWISAGELVHPVELLDRLPPPRYWSGWDYTRAIKLKCNMLPTLGIPSNPPAKRRCRGGCQKTESVSHVLQQCPVAHWKRINRHDRICNHIKKMHKQSTFR